MSKEDQENLLKYVLIGTKLCSFRGGLECDGESICGGVPVSLVNS